MDGIYAGFAGAKTGYRRYVGPLYRRSKYDSEGPEIYLFEGPVRTAYPDGRIHKTKRDALPGGVCGF